MEGSLNKRRPRQKEAKTIEQKAENVGKKITDGTPKDCNKMDLVGRKCGNKKRKKRTSLRYFISFFGDEGRT